MQIVTVAKPLIQSIFYGNPDTHPPIINSSRLLVEAGYQVNLFCREDGQHWQVNYPKGVQIYRIKVGTRSSWQEYLGFLLKIFRLTKREPSIFVGHDMHGFMVAYLMARAYGQASVYHCHDFFDDDGIIGVGGLMVSKFERRYAKNADLVIIPDAERAVGIARVLKLTKAPLIVANGPMASRKAEGEVLHSELARLGKHFSRIVFRPGMIGFGHAVEPTILSIPLWKSKDWGFVVMGRHTLEYAEKLKALAASVGVSEQFVILPPVSYDQVPAYTRGADVGHGLYDLIDNSTCFNTTASNKLIEYMAAGIPQLVSDRPSLRNFVEKYQCGIVAQENSPPSIANAVNILFSDLEKCGEMGEAGRCAFEKEFTYEHQFAPALKLFQKLQRGSFT